MMDTEQKYYFLYSDEKCDFCETKTFAFWPSLLGNNDTWKNTFYMLMTLGTMILDILSPESWCLHLFYCQIQYSSKFKWLHYRKQDTGALKVKHLCKPPLSFLSILLLPRKLKYGA